MDLYLFEMRKSNVGVSRQGHQTRWHGTVLLGTQHVDFVRGEEGRSNVNTALVMDRELRDSVARGANLNTLAHLGQCGMEVVPC